MPAAYYTFTAGPVQFFALDTSNVALSQKQREWLDRELTSSQARWKIVYGHHPIYSDGNYEDRPDLIASLLPILANRVDAYFCGRDHNLQALQAQGGVRLYVTRGKDLADPAKLLEGSGGQARWLNLDGASTLSSPEVARLIDGAIAGHPVPFPSTGRGSVTVRPTSAQKRRQRR